MAERLIYLVFSNPVSEDRVEEFHKWYDETHIPEVLAIPGFVSAQRIELRPTEATKAAEPSQRFGAIYEIDRDPEEIMAAIGEGTRNGTIHMSDALDLTSFRMAFWRRRGEMAQAKKL